MWDGFLVEREKMFYTGPKRLSPAGVWAEPQQELHLSLVDPWQELNLSLSGEKNSCHNSNGSRPFYSVFAA